MPYASNKQAAFMHARAAAGDEKMQEITSRWHEEGHGYVKGGKNDPNRKKRRRRVRKSKTDAGWLRPLAIGTAGGALANQLPSFEEQRRIRENRRRRKAKMSKKVGGILPVQARYHALKPKKKRGEVKKIDAPQWPTDANFNARAAQQAYDLVMKMDRDTAEMFTTMVVSDAFEQDIEGNRRALQKHLDDVLAKRFVHLKRATMRVVSKGDGDSRERIAFAQALALMEEISKVKTPRDYGYVWREEDVRRDPGSGQFQTKVKRTQTKPIHDKVAQSMGIPDHPQKNGKFSSAQKAQYQDEYRQLANFLGMVHQSTPNPGDTRIDLHFEDKQGNQWVERAESTRPKAKMLDPTDRSLKGISAAPAGLNVGGVAFGLQGALGGGMQNPMRVAQINAGAKQMPEFAEQWTTDYGRADTNAQLYGRTKAAGKFLTEIAPEGSKANLAGHFGNFVGSYGPQAEAVIGPPARKTAYRYRGTEKKPDQAMVRGYEKEVRTQMAGRGWDEESHKANRLAQNRAVREKVKQVADATNTPEDAVRLTDEQRSEALNSVRGKSTLNTSDKPTWQEQNIASQAIMGYLQRPTTHEEGGAAPAKGLYNLQLASGNTPPSEGVILDRDGQIITQAIGYGDDHYLPFNLKNLKGLKGGSYIRNRSVGGLTSEDIYTGLVSGARRVTVVSRSGTFTMEFEPDFRGGRRHNDKAARMTRRYEQLLDAVQSEQVERQDIDPDVRRAIVQSVRVESDELGRGVMNAKDIREEVNRRVDEYKSSPDIDSDTQQYIDLIVNNRTAGMTAPDSRRIRAQVMNDVAADKEYKFRLNGVGYAAALEGLREQFPYYIKVTAQPTREPERIETERDLGYVEPGRIRPTAAAAGLFGGAKRPAFAQMGGKVSAAQADYAGGFKRPELKTEAPKTEGETTTAEGEKPAATAAPAAIDQQARSGYVEAAVKTQQAIKDNIRFEGTGTPDWTKMDAEAFRTHLQNKDNLADFDKYVATHPQLAQDKTVEATLGAYHQAAGRMGQKPYEAALNQQWGAKPYSFPDASGTIPKAYQAGANDKERYKEVQRIGATKPGVVNVKPLDHMSDSELEQEVNAVARIRRLMSGIQGTPTFEEKKEIFAGVNKDSPSLPLVFKDEKSMDDYLATVHRTRAINLGVPADQRGWKEVQHNPITEEKNTEEPTRNRVDEMRYWAEKAQDLYPQGSTEHEQLASMRRDLNAFGDTLRTNDELAPINDAHPDAIRLIMQGLHENKIPAYKPEPKKTPPKAIGS
jgi:hypothetical protein